MRKLFIIGVACLAFTACKTEVKKTDTKDAIKDAFNADAFKSDIAASNTSFENAWATGDSATFGALYTSDGCMYPTGMAPICGREGIKGYFMGGFQMGVRKVKLTTNEVFGTSEFVSETGTFNILDSAGTSLDNGKYIVIWKKDGDAWRMHRDIWNTNMSAMPADTSHKK